MGALAVDVKGGYVKTRLMAGILRVAGADAGGWYLVNENSTGQKGQARLETSLNAEGRKYRAAPGNAARNQQREANGNNSK